LLDSYILSIQQDASGELWVEPAPASITATVGISRNHFGSRQLDRQFRPATRLHRFGQVLAVSHSRLFQLTRASTGGAWSVAPFVPQPFVNAHPELVDIYSVYASRDGSVWLAAATPSASFFQAAT